MCSGVYIIGSYQRQNQSYKVISGILNIYRFDRPLSVYFFRYSLLSVSYRVVKVCFQTVSVFGTVSGLFFVFDMQD